MNEDGPLVAMVLPKPAGARVGIRDMKNGVDVAVLWFHDVGYAGQIAAAINAATAEHFETEGSQVASAENNPT